MLTIFQKPYLKITLTPPLVWYYYDVPENSGPTEPAPPVSQIPLLNGLPPPQCEPIPQRRGGEGINSKYIKLAKAGGRKGNLISQHLSLSQQLRFTSRLYI